MNERKKLSLIINYTGIMFILALGFFLYQFVNTNYDRFGIHFRFLTFWALTGALVISGLLLIKRVRGTLENYHALSSTVAVLNAVVVFLYWKMFFIDPSLVNIEPLPWYQEYYLHIVGPSLIIIDALIINKSFTRHKQALSGIVLICVIYILWIEYVVSPLNLSPVGEITRGLPYPFLNNLSSMQRSMFYGSTILTAISFYMVGWFIAFIYTRIQKRKLVAY
jgi:hypothetical protein